MKILVIEDHTTLGKLIQNALVADDFVCELVQTYQKAAEKIDLYQYDLLVVDINLPDGTGLDIIREIKRKRPTTGVIVISARNSLSNKIEGLDLGADDYIIKPFDIAELIARVKSLTRRLLFSGSDEISIGKITIHTSQKTVIIDNKVLELTKSEYEILLFFFSNHGRVLSKESIAEHIWGDHMDLVDSFDFIYSHIKNLRKKITNTGIDDPIKVIYGTGYKLDITP